MSYDKKYDDRSNNRLFKYFPPINEPISFCIY